MSYITPAEGRSGVAAHAPAALSRRNFMGKRPSPRLKKPDDIAYPAGLPLASVGDPPGIGVRGRDNALGTEATAETIDSFTRVVTLSLMGCWRQSPDLTVGVERCFRPGEC